MTIEYLTVSNWIHLHSATVDPGRCKSGVAELTILAAAVAAIRVPAGRAFAGLYQRCVRRQPRSLSVRTDGRALQMPGLGQNRVKLAQPRCAGHAFHLSPGLRCGPGPQLWSGLPRTRAPR